MKNHLKNLTFLFFLLCNFAFLPGCLSDNNGQNQQQPELKNTTDDDNSSRIENKPKQFVLADDDHRVEHRFSGLEEISSYGTTYYPDVVQARVLPRGSALITQSGNLGVQGITRIIHAASGSSGNISEHFIPSLEGVTLSVNNSLRLARLNHINRIAIPFIGRGIFMQRIGATEQQLAETIIRSALENRGSVEVRFVIVGPNGPGSDFQLFQNVLQSILAEPAFQDVQASDVQVVNGNIINFATHGASAIVNAANMEVRFGGGISGAIAAATGAGNSNFIDTQARELIRNFNDRVTQLLSESHLRL